MGASNRRRPDDGDGPAVPGASRTHRARRRRADPAPARRRRSRARTARGAAPPLRHVCPGHRCGDGCDNRGADRQRRTRALAEPRVRGRHRHHARHTAGHAHPAPAPASGTTSLQHAVDAAQRDAGSADWSHPADLARGDRDGRGRGRRRRAGHHDPRTLWRPDCAARCSPANAHRARTRCRRGRVRAPAVGRSRR